MCTHFYTTPENKILNFRPQLFLFLPSWNMGPIEVMRRWRYWGSPQCEKKRFISMFFPYRISIQAGYSWYQKDQSRKWWRTLLAASHQQWMVLCWRKLHCLWGCLSNSVFLVPQKGPSVKKTGLFYGLGPKLLFIGPGVWKVYFTVFYK